MSFVYGLVSGPVVFSFGGIVFLLLSRRRAAAAAGPYSTASDNFRRDDPSDFERLVTAVLAELKRRDTKPRASAAPERQLRTEEAPFH